MTPAQFRAVREALSYTQTMMGERLGITQSAVSRIERGNARPSEKGHVPRPLALRIEDWAEISDRRGAIVAAALREAGGDDHE